MRIDESLRRIAKGEILTDDWNRLVYSVDSSNFQIVPQAIVCPLDSSDVLGICERCSLGNLPITARGAGTGLLGQSLTNGVVLDFTKHMNRVLEVNDDLVVVQPGIVKASLDKELRKKGRCLPPDPASDNYCTVGGMIANNSSGMHCLGYGDTIDFLEEVEIAYADGTAGFASSKRFDPRMQKLREILFSSADVITSRFPRVRKNSCGYRLDAVIAGSAFQPQKVFAASEGTLGVITSATLKIVDIPEHRCIMVLGFEDLLGSLSAVPQVLEFCPVALEMLDYTAVSLAETSMKNSKKDRGCILFVEFAGRNGEPERRMKSCEEKIGGSCDVLEYASDEQSITRIWNARKGALNNIMKLIVGSRKPIGLIEDTVVPIPKLVDHGAYLLRAYNDYHLDYAIYGHVGDGNMHTRPLVDLHLPSEIHVMESLAKNLFTNVVKAGGSITGEHGDGIARTAYIELMYGSKICDIFLAVKKLFDPAFIMNPGKKVPLALHMQK